MRLITKDYDRLLDEIKNQYFKLKKKNLPVFYIEKGRIKFFITSKADIEARRSKFLTL